MHRIIGLVAIGALAACSQVETEQPAVETTEEAVQPETGSLAADGQPAPGNYTITTADGQVYVEEVREDGTFTSTGPDGKVETGTWVQKSPELYCTTMDEEGAQEKCHTEAIDNNGVWTSTDPDSGEVVTVERVTA